MVVKVLGALAGLFALVLVVLPALRVASGRLPVRQAAGLWIAAAGFALLAAAAFVVAEDAVPGVMLAGVVLAVAGNLVQRRVTRRAG
jgi:hypothetical protein